MNGVLMSLSGGKTHGPGKASLSKEQKNQICRIVCREKPKGQIRWSICSLGKRIGGGHDAVNRILRERGIKPHLVKRFQLSNDSAFEEKLNDVVRLYLNPLANAIVVCVDEKSQIGH